jgi:hypothetical protein
MNNNGYFGIPGNNYFGAGSNLTQSTNTSTSVSNAKAIAGIGQGLNILGSGLDIFAIGNQNEQLQKSKEQVQRMSNLQLKAIEAQQNLQDIESAKTSRNLIGTQLSQASVTGASLNSASVIAANQQAAIADYNRQFINSMNANTAKVNVLYQKQKQLQQIYDTEQANQYKVFGDIANIALSAAALALL